MEYLGVSRGVELGVFERGRLLALMTGDIGSVGGMGSVRDGDLVSALNSSQEHFLVSKCDADDEGAGGEEEEEEVVEDRGGDEVDDRDSSFVAEQAHVHRSRITELQEEIAGIQQSLLRIGGEFVEEKFVGEQLVPKTTGQKDEEEEEEEAAHVVYSPPLSRPRLSQGARYATASS
jgi:hypothetical protein